MRELNRRELLAAFLGATAAAGCGARPSSALPPGELVGASDSLGHRLREFRSVELPQERFEPRRVVIVGGGVAGLSAARRLLQGGLDDFLLVELEEEPGGTARGGESAWVRYPWGAHYLPAPTRDNPALIRLLEEVGALDGRDEQGDPLVAEVCACRDPESRVFYKGTWFEGLYLQAGATAADLAELKAFESEVNRWVAWRDGRERRAFDVPMSRGSDDPEVRALDQLSMAKWLDERGWHSPRLRWYVDYACRDDYGLRLEQTSAWAGLYYFAARVAEPGSPSRPFITWPEGNSRLVRHLYEPLQDHARLGLAVASIEARHEDGKPRIDVVAIDARGEPALACRCERVIFAAPQFLARYLITVDGGGVEPRDEFQYGAWAVANLTLEAPPVGRGFPLAWDNVLYESPSLGYVATSYQRGLDYGPALLTYYYPLCDADPRAARQRLLEVDREGWAEIAMSDLERAHPEIRVQTRRVDVIRWGHAMILPRPGFIWGEARQEAARPAHGIHFAHSDLSGLPLFEEAFYHGTRAAEEVLQALDRPLPSSL